MSGRTCDLVGKKKPVKRKPHNRPSAHRQRELAARRRKVREKARRA